MLQEQKEQFSEILNFVGETLDITKSQYDAAVTSYNAVGEYLSSPESNLAPYKPEILPQGSFMLGTMIRPLNEGDELDIDLVCQLTGKQQKWSQYELKKGVGNRLKSHAVYKDLLNEPDGRRCWTLSYRSSSTLSGHKYHMDILPAIVDKGYRLILEKAFLAVNEVDDAELAVRITDKEREDYYFEPNHMLWLKSNPFGYGRWFFSKASLGFLKSEVLMESVQPVKTYQKDKLPLQRIVQLLKRHRDMMFNGDDDKPISIIITTLAAQAYNKDPNVTSGLEYIVEHLTDFISERYSTEHGRVIKWIENPINPEENFADKWAETPEKEKNFYDWHNQLKIDLNAFQGSIGKGLNELQKSFSSSFGENIASEAFSKYGNDMRTKRDRGLLKMSTNTGIISGIGKTPLKAHNFEGGDK